MLKQALEGEGLQRGQVGRPLGQVAGAFPSGLAVLYHASCSLSAPLHAGPYQTHCPSLASWCPVALCLLFPLPRMPCPLPSPGHRRLRPLLQEAHLVHQVSIVITPTLSCFYLFRAAP